MKFSTKLLIGLTAVILGSTALNKRENDTRDIAVKVSEAVIAANPDSDRVGFYFENFDTLKAEMNGNLYLPSLIVKTENDTLKLLDLHILIIPTRDYIE